MNWSWILISFVAPAGAAVQLPIWLDQDRHELAKRSIGEGEVALENTVSFYQTEMLIGNPPQRVIVQVDTGSSDLWVISSDNPYCKLSSSRCSEGSTFDPAQSDSLSINRTAMFSIAYGDSTFASGVYVQDDVQIGGVEFVADPTHGSGSSKGVFGRENQGTWVRQDKRDLPQLPNCDVGSIGEGTHGRVSSNSDYAADVVKRNDPQSAPLLINQANFAVATKANSSEAVWGIGMENTESMARNINFDGQLYPTYSNIPMQMKEQGHIETIAYSLWLNDLSSASGSLLFGAVDHAKYQGQLQKVPLIKTYKELAYPLDFSIMLHGIGVFNQQAGFAKIIDCSIPVLLDSGTTYTQLPRQLIQPIADSLGAIYDRRSGVFLVSESQKQKISNGGVRFNLSGVEIDVESDELLIPVGPLKRLHVDKFKQRIQTSQDIEIGNDLLENNANFFGPEAPGSQSSKDLDEKSLSEESEFQEEDEYSEEDDYFDEYETELTDPMSIKARKKLENYYLLGMFPIESSVSSSYILGDTFLRSAYVVYDLENKEIALAKTQHNVTDSQIDIIGKDGIPLAKPADRYSATAVSDVIVRYPARSVFGDHDDSEGSPIPVVGQSETLSFCDSPCMISASTSFCCKHPTTTQRLTRFRTHHNGATAGFDSRKTYYFLLSWIVFYLTYLL